MITAQEYRSHIENLLTEYEARVREWLNKNGEHKLSETIPFFRDGVTCPEKWYAPNNDFRPLFILKEVSLGIDTRACVEQFHDTWGNQTRFEFAENPFDDIKIGKFLLWRKIAALAKGLEEIHNGADTCPYGKFDMSYQTGGDEYTGDIKGYLDYHARTANPAYNDIIEKVAVLELKKIGGGRSANSELSLATKHYTEHIAPFQDLICREIELINPTVIICCSREIFTQNLLSAVKNNTTDRLWIYGYHPTMNSIKHFYEEPLAAYKEYIFSL